jgi:hypothetical protein
MLVRAKEGWSVGPRRAAWVDVGKAENDPARESDLWRRSVLRVYQYIVLTAYLQGNQSQHGNDELDTVFGAEFEETERRRRDLRC